jgi:hypothetical protein
MKLFVESNEEYIGAEELRFRVATAIQRHSARIAVSMF